MPIGVKSLCPINTVSGEHHRGFLCCFCLSGDSSSLFAVQGSVGAAQEGGFHTDLVKSAGNSADTTFLTAPGIAHVLFESVAFKTTTGRLART
ncbi:MAG: hypothetical protein OXU40_05120 [Nitrospira sp.]|nr:hypothetical protein [Nitrospira sp.]